MKKNPTSKNIIKSDLQNIRARLDTILNINTSDLGEQINECLHLLDREVERVKKQANGYPDKGGNAGVWFDGVTLANYSKTLADFLSTKDFLKEQLHATGLWAKATLSAVSYTHLTLPTKA